jgi:hypothetical protein
MPQRPPLGRPMSPCGSGPADGRPGGPNGWRPAAAACIEREARHRQGDATEHQLQHMETNERNLHHDIDANSRAGEQHSSRCAHRATPAQPACQGRGHRDDSEEPHARHQQFGKSAGKPALSGAPPLPNSCTVPATAESDRSPSATIMRRRCGHDCVVCRADGVALRVIIVITAFRRAPSAGSRIARPATTVSRRPTSRSARSTGLGRSGPRPAGCEPVLPRRIRR